MKASRKFVLIAASCFAAAWGLRIQQIICAQENPFKQPTSTQPTTNQGWTLKNPDATYAIAADICPGLSNSALAAQAMSKDPDQAKSAIDQLRANGQAGLDAIIEANKAEVMTHRSGNDVMATGAKDTAWPKISAAIDAVAMQHDAYASGLYWHTDLNAAKMAARAQGKPILSLRLLGKLNEEYSCANSRFFRTALYANADVSKYLREHFILHWESVRPVPVITIDFGDGRVIRRTITGNSIHFVLTPDGNVVDGIPGLYGQKAFLSALQAAEAATQQCLRENSPDETRTLADWHRAAARKDLDELGIDCATVGITQSRSKIRNSDFLWTGSETLFDWDFIKTETQSTFYSRNFRFDNGALLDLDGLRVQTGADGLPKVKTKHLDTTIILALVSGADTREIIAPDFFAPYCSGAPGLSSDWPGTYVTSIQGVPLNDDTTPENLAEADWTKLAMLHADDAALDAGSRALMEQKSPDAETAAQRAMSKSLVEKPLLRTIRNFEKSIALDTVRNEYLLHLQLHRWLADPANAALVHDVSALNKRVYAELFLTPDSDPWLGLVPPDNYSGLDNGGLCTPK